MSSTVDAVILSAFLVFLATAVVHGFVVPWAQARTRRRERWETALSELFALLADELARALDEYRRDAVVEIGLIADLIGSGMPLEYTERVTKKLGDTRRKTSRELDGPIRRVVILGDILRARKPRRIEWVGMYLRVEDLRFRVSMMTKPPNPRVDEREIFYRNVSDVERARMALIEHIKPIRDLMRLPRPVLDPLGRIVRRPLGWLLWPAVKLRGRLAKWLTEVDARQAAPRTVPVQRDETATEPHPVVADTPDRDADTASGESGGRMGDRFRLPRP